MGICNICQQPEEENFQAIEYVQVEDALEIATLAGGCFWCIEGLFKQVRGIKKVVSGYCGGNVDFPTYE